jgi:hypothetical protein
MVEIWVLMTVLMGSPHGMAVFKSEAECQSNLALQKAAKTLATWTILVLPLTSQWIQRPNLKLRQGSRLREMDITKL